MHLYVRTYVRSYIPKFIRKYIPSYIHTYQHTYMHKYIHTYQQTYLYTYKHTYIHTYRGSRSKLMRAFRDPNIEMQESRQFSQRSRACFRTIALVFFICLALNILHDTLTATVLCIPGENGSYLGACYAYTCVCVCVGLCVCVLFL